MDLFIFIFIFIYLQFNCKLGIASTLFLTPTCHQLRNHQQAVSTVMYVKAQAGCNRDPSTLMLSLAAPAASCDIGTRLGQI